MTSRRHQCGVKVVTVTYLWRHWYRSMTDGVCQSDAKNNACCRFHRNWLLWRCHPTSAHSKEIQEYCIRYLLGVRGAGRELHHKGLTARHHETADTNTRGGERICLFASPIYDRFFSSVLSDSRQNVRFLAYDRWQRLTFWQRGYRTSFTTDKLALIYCQEGYVN